MMIFNTRQRLVGLLRRTMISIRNPGTRFGSNIYIGRNSSISRIYNLTFGDNIYIGKNVTIEAECELGSNILIGNNVGIVGRRDHDVFSAHVPAFLAPTVRDDRSLSLKTYIGSGTWIGFGAIILSGVRIGENSVIASGAVVLHDIPSGVVAAGNPARVIRSLVNH